MDLQDAYYELRFETAFLRAKGDEFQTFFERLMGLAYKADFMACRPWGKMGDRKNDDFLKSDRRLCQVYAPNEMSATKATAKIKEDFGDAKVYWKKHFDKWSFVHNATDGLPPHVQEILLDFQKDNPTIKLEPWGFELHELPDTEGRTPTFRSLFSYFVRRQQSEAFATPEKQAAMQQASDYQVAFLYLLGLD